MTSTTSADIQTALLKVLADPNTDKRLGRGRHYLVQEVYKRLEAEQVYSGEVMAAMWTLIAQGLAYIDFSQPAPENWLLIPTDAGTTAARDNEINPDNSGEYLARLTAMVPNASSTVLSYAREAIASYSGRCYLASAVMLGVASEAAFLEMASTFANWLPQEQSQRFHRLIETQRSNYIAKFAEFRKRVEPHKSELPAELSDGMALTLDSVLDLLRIYRNDAGHPTGKQISRDDAFISLQMFARYLQKLYALKAFFEGKTF
jgi:hypothetical protein